MEEQETRKEQQELPYSYGTGRRPEQERRHSLTMSMLWVLVGVSMAFNLFLLKKLAGREAELSHDRQTVQWSYLPQSGSEQSDQGGLLQSVESGLVQIVPDGEEAFGCAGVILSEDGYILTNASLLDGRQELTVILPDGSGCEARMIGMDGDSDLAVLKTEATNLCPVQ
ncbi:MAG: trypsin-like peptidase domain-containing protein, partial [Oscillospiraceae bacterium]|nr:trypsin-like peptidase domain-containing protein [Oscillospiraceae bacterium]